MVTGAVAFLYNNGCVALWNLYDADPDSAMKLVKYWILQGTDTLASLAGRSATDGRLNLYRSLMAMYKWCGKSDPTYSTEDPQFRGLRVFPNPVASGASLKFSRELDMKGSVHILDMSGRLLRACAINGVIGEVEIGPLKPGTYLFQLNTSGSQKTLLFQVQ